MFAKVCQNEEYILYTFAYIKSDIQKSVHQKNYSCSFYTKFIQNVCK